MTRHVATALAVAATAQAGAPFGRKLQPPSCIVSLGKLDGASGRFHSPLDPAFR